MLGTHKFYEKKRRNEKIILHSKQALSPPPPPERLDRGPAVRLPCARSPAPPPLASPRPAHRL
ncbi:hypothetical protein U9M48_006102 [Paspalum notatum var. saurae]|uniref:Uncharacterized protein n=1 Tax=Paspalum notatum var. saurae TaxID=547442 RepID=A0AAQ3SKG7_PASNO